MDCQSSVPRDPNNVFWLAEKWLTLFAFVAVLKMLRASWCNWLELDIQRVDQEDRLHRCESYPGTATLKDFLDQELNKHEDDEKFNYCQLHTTDRAILTTFTATYKEYKETLIDVIDDLTRHSYIAKLKITSSWYRTKSKATTGVKNTASYIPWLYTTWDQMVASNMIHCVLALMTTTITQAFCIKFKQCLFIILKLITHI